MLHLDHLMIAQSGFHLSADWQAEPGARLALIGPSGAGKSTLLAVLAGFVPPASGRVLWQGADITGVPPGKRPMSILFQDQNLFPHLTLTQNLALGLAPRIRLSRVDPARIEGALARVGLAGMGERRPGTLSGGQASRAALARTLLRARPILLLDEPFAALGPALKAEMRALLAEVATETGALTLLVTHHPAEARAFAPCTVLVADGVALPPQPTAALLDHPPPALAAYLGA